MFFLQEFAGNSTKKMRDNDEKLHEEAFLNLGKTTPAKLICILLLVAGWQFFISPHDSGLKSRVCPFGIPNSPLEKP